jgi:hypothetical protein
LDGVVFVSLGQVVPETPLNDRSKQATGVALSNAEGVSYGGEEINTVRLGIFEES